MDTPTYVTAAGLEKLKADHKELKQVTIPAIAARIDEAKQLGDLSENAEYHAAKEDMAWAQTKNQELEEKLHNTKVIEQPSSSDNVQIGSTITVQTGDKERVLTIVGASEAAPAAGRISNESPLGEAFLGRSVGDEIEVDTPGGKKNYTVKNIS